MGTTESKCIETEINKKIEEIKKKQEELAQLAQLQQQQKQNIPPAPVVNIGIPPAPVVNIPGVVPPAPVVLIPGVPTAPVRPSNTSSIRQEKTGAASSQSALWKSIKDGVMLKPVKKDEEKLEQKKTEQPKEGDFMSALRSKLALRNASLNNGDQEKNKQTDENEIPESEWDKHPADTWTNLKSFSANSCNLKKQITDQNELDSALKIMSMLNSFKSKYPEGYNELIQQEQLDIQAYQQEINRFQQSQQVPSVYPSPAVVAAAMSKPIPESIPLEAFLINQPVTNVKPNAPPLSPSPVASGPSVVVAPKLTKELRVRNHKREINIENDDFGQFLSSNDELSYQASSRANANIKQLMLQASCAQKTCYDSYLLTMYYWQQHDDQKFKRQKDADSCNIFKDQVLGK